MLASPRPDPGDASITPSSPVRTLRPLPELDYHHSQTVDLPVAITPLEAWNLMTSGQGPVMRAAFRIRDAISARFGVKRIGGFSGAPRDSVQTGDRLDFFLVEDSAPERLVLTERDRHLARRLTVTASVVTHNAYGRIYMLPVGIAHKVIVARYIRHLRRAVQERAPRPGVA